MSRPKRFDAVVQVPVSQEVYDNLLLRAVKCGDELAPFCRRILLRSLEGEGR